MQTIVLASSRSVGIGGQGRLTGGADVKLPRPHARPSGPCMHGNPRGGGGGSEQPPEENC